MSYSSIDKSANPVSESSLFNDFLVVFFFTKSSDFSSLQIDVVYPNLLMDVSTSHTEVTDILCKLGVNKATGVAGIIPARILKECEEELSYQLALLFNISLKSGRVPFSWKRENATPVFLKLALQTRWIIIDLSPCYYPSLVNVKRRLYIKPYILMGPFPVSLATRFR